MLAQTFGTQVVEIIRMKRSRRGRWHIEVGRGNHCSYLGNTTFSPHARDPLPHGTKQGWTKYPRSSQPVLAHGSTGRVSSTLLPRFQAEEWKVAGAAGAAGAAEHPCCSDIHSSPLVLSRLTVFWSEQVEALHSMEDYRSVVPRPCNSKIAGMSGAGQGAVSRSRR